MAALGVPRSGAVDEAALRLANRLVGNPEGAAGLEVTLSGCAVRAAAAMTVAVTGARAEVRIGGQIPARAGGQGSGRLDGPAGARAGGPAGWRSVEWGMPVSVMAGDVVEVGAAWAGVRAYLVVGGGIAVAPVLGSRATDTLSGLGPAVVRDGDVLPVGVPPGAPAGVDVAPYPVPGGQIVPRVWPGPRVEWFTAAAVEVLLGAAYRVSPTSNRVGARLSGPALERAVHGELPSEGLVLGAVQVPTGGEPLVFLADHPTTGGYPVIAVVEPADLPLLAQARPGTVVRFRPVGRWVRPGAAGGTPASRR
jgi:allophanate hydrolase subunit 2